MPRSTVIFAALIIVSALLLLCAGFLQVETGSTSGGIVLVQAASWLLMPMMTLAFCGLAFHDLKSLAAVRNSVLLLTNNIGAVAAILAAYALAYTAVDLLVVTLVFGPAWSFPINQLHDHAYAALGEDPLAGVIRFGAQLLLPFALTLTLTFAYREWTIAIAYPGTTHRIG
jgi:hypothetical protein